MDLEGEKWSLLHSSTARSRFKGLMDSLPSVLRGVRGVISSVGRRGAQFARFSPKMFSMRKELDSFVWDWYGVQDGGKGAALRRAKCRNVCASMQLIQRLACED